MPTWLVHAGALRAALSITLLSAATLAQPARSESPAPRSVNRLALAWAMGNWGSPLVCEFEERPLRGIRRVHIVPAARHVYPPAAWIRFVDLDADEARRCTSDLGEAQPNILGQVQIRLPGGYNERDTAARDFKEALRRDKGFEFFIPTGRLRVIPVGREDAEARDLDFTGGAAKLQLVARGSDAARALREFPSTRLVTLELQTRDGDTLRLPLFLSGPPPRPFAGVQFPRRSADAGAMDAARFNPIHSAFEDDPALREPINEFVIELAETIDLLQDAEVTGALKALASLSEKLIEQSERFGYKPMAEIAREVARAGLEGDAEAARKGLEELTDVGRRIRMGHRGAA